MEALNHPNIDWDIEKKRYVRSRSGHSWCGVFTCLQCQLVTHISAKSSHYLLDEECPSLQPRVHASVRPHDVGLGWMAGRYAAVVRPCDSVVDSSIVAGIFFPPGVQPRDVGQGWIVG